MSKNKSGNKANVSNPTITKRHIDTAFSFLIHEVESGNETVVRRLWESVFYNEESLADAYMHDQDLMEFDEFPGYLWDLINDTEDLSITEMIEVASIMKCDPSVVDLLSKQQNLTVETQEISSEIAEIYLDALDPSNFTDDVCTLLWGLLSNYKRENIFLYDVIDIVSLLIQDDDVVRDFVLKELNEIDMSKTSQDSTKQYIVRKCEDVIDENDMARWLFSEEEVFSRRLALATSCASIIT